MIKQKFNWLKIVVFVLVIAVIYLVMNLLGLTWNDVKENWEVVSGIITLTAGLFGMYAKATGSKKAEEAAKALNIVNEYAQEAVEDAEDLLGISGEIKKKYALGYIRDKCTNNGIPYSEPLASSLIEKFVVLSNKVGARHAAEEAEEG